MDMDKTETKVNLKGTRVACYDI